MARSEFEASLVGSLPLEDLRTMLSDDSESEREESEGSEESEDGEPRTRESKRTNDTQPRKLPEAVKRLIGEASMSYVRKNYSQATECALTAIRLAPQVADSYQTLGMIYSDLNDRKTAREYFMIAAHMTRTDAGLWKRLADMYREDGDMEQYYYCLSKAVMHNPRNISLLFERVVAGRQMADARGVLTTFQYLITLDGTATTARQIATALVSEGRRRDALRVVSGAVRQRMKEGKRVGADLANLGMELFLENDKPGEMVGFAEEWMKHENLVAETAPLEVRVNIALAHIRSGVFTRHGAVVDELLAAGAVDLVALVVLLADALASQEQWQQALDLYAAAHNNPLLDTPALWASMAVCHARLGNMEKAIGLASRAHGTVGHRGDITLLLVRHYAKEGDDRAVLGVAQHYLDSLGQTTVGAFEREEEQNAFVRILAGKFKAEEALEMCGEAEETFLVLVGKVIQKEELDNVRSRIKVFRFSKSRRWRHAAVLAMLGMEPVEEKPREVPSHRTETEPKEEGVFTRGRRRKGRSATLTVAPPLPNPMIEWKENETDEKEKEDMQDEREGDENGMSEEEKETSEEPESEQDQAMEWEDGKINQSEEEMEEKETHEMESRTTDKTTTQKGIRKKAGREKDKSTNTRTVREIAGVFVLLEEVLGQARLRRMTVRFVRVCLARRDEDVCRKTVEGLLGVLRPEEQDEVALRMSFVNIAVAQGCFGTAVRQMKALGLLLPHRTDVWVYFNRVVALSGAPTNPSLLKYVNRVHTKHPTNTAVTILLGNLFMTTGQFGKALQNYLSVPTRDQSPLLHLHAALAFFGNVTNRNTIDKAACCLNALSFAEKYLKTCRYRKEALYNIGRMNHQIMNVSTAMAFYEKALGEPPVDPRGWRERGLTRRGVARPGGRI